MTEIGRNECLRRMLDDPNEEYDNESYMSPSPEDSTQPDESNASQNSVSGQIKHLSEAQQSTLLGMQRTDLLTILDRIASGDVLDSAIKTVSNQIAEAIKSAKAEQYQTLDYGKNGMSVGDYARVDLATGKSLTGSESTQKPSEDIPAAVGPSQTLSGLFSFGSAAVIQITEQEVMHLQYMARYTPLRLGSEERRLLRLLESTLEVSEYTDKVDILVRGNKSHRIVHEIRNVCAVLCGLAVANNFGEGQKLIKQKNFCDISEFFQDVFEIGRRYKILNPERMRDSYGKLIYLLQDSQQRDVKDLLGFKCVQPVRTVKEFLDAKKDGKAFLSDPLILTAIKVINSDGKSRSEVQHELLQKEAAIKSLLQKYSSNGNKKSQRNKYLGLLARYTMIFPRQQSDSGSDSAEDDAMFDEQLTVDDIEQCLYSLTDYNTFLHFNRDPCAKMIKYLDAYFHQFKVESEFSLQIQSGRQGARLDHDHSRQFLYVKQSLYLWMEVLTEIHALWTIAEGDLLDEHRGYQLMDTGQGLQRVQISVTLQRAMQTLLRRVKEKVGGWVGSSTVHLGDHNVPNALIFIDKYTQIPRILGPIVLCLDKIPNVLKANPKLKEYVQREFGSETRLKKIILHDFFRHAFDGSGADNFYDAGSCIDGRLTSAWNWCSRIEKQPFFPVFLLTGFTGFDGSFK